MLRGSGYATKGGSNSTSTVAPEIERGGTRGEEEENHRWNTCLVSDDCGAELNSSWFVKFVTHSLDLLTPSPPPALRGGLFFFLTSPPLPVEASA